MINGEGQVKKRYKDEIHGSQHVRTYAPAYNLSQPKEKLKNTFQEIECYFHISREPIYILIQLQTAGKHIIVSYYI